MARLIAIISTLALAVGALAYTPSAEQPALAKDAAEDRERRQLECASCASVLISRLQSSNHEIYDNEKTPAQARRLVRDVKLAEAGKVKPRLWYTAYRENAQYNFVWRVTIIPSTTPETMVVWAAVYEVSSNRKLYETSHRSSYWASEQPDERCLLDALNFLRGANVAGSDNGPPPRTLAKMAASVDQQPAAIRADIARSDNPTPAVNSWPRPDAHGAVSPVDTESSCPLTDVLNAASRRVQDLVVSMQRVSATERVELSELDKGGKVRNAAQAKFSYVAYIHEGRPGQLTVEEYRNDSVGVQEFPAKLATTGTAAFALIFHPLYLKDFAVTCERLADLNGHRAWELHLVQTRGNNFRGYRAANLYFPVMLKGRAWVDAESHEVLRLETDLLKTIPEIPLVLEHIIIDYGSVEFPKRKLQLWLPQTAEIEMDYRGRRYHHKHAFSDFQLFWVDTEEKVKAP